MVKASMPRLSLDAMTSAILLVLGAAMVWEGAAVFAPAVPAAGCAAAGTAGLPATPPPEAELARVRVLVDGNAAAGGEAAAALAREYPASPEALVLLARSLEGRGAPAGEAVRAWARAVEIDPALADARAPRYLGGRIGELAERELARLRDLRRARSLDAAEEAELSDVYYLRRRLAGGCE
jgi:hypothetical protein